MGRSLKRELLPAGATGFAFGGEIYCPGDPAIPGQDPAKVYSTAGDEVELPKEFPSDADLEATLARAKRGLPSSGPLDRNVGRTRENEADLEGMTKDELAKLADERGVDVTRSDGESGNPVKADYVKALLKANKER